MKVDVRQNHPRSLVELSVSKVSVALGSAALVARELPGQLRS